MYEILVTNEQSALAVDEDRLRAIAADTLRGEGVATAEVAIAIVDDATIHAVNRDHLGHDYPTDVISFSYAESDAGPRCIDGELVVSAETAARAAAEFGWSPADELALYVVHGLLHLCGYDDRTPHERQAMRAREQAALKIWNLTPHYVQDEFDA